jgi:hypothetical protein
MRGEARRLEHDLRDLEAVRTDLDLRPVRQLRTRSPSMSTRGTVHSL